MCKLHRATISECNERSRYFILMPRLLRYFRLPSRFSRWSNQIRFSRCLRHFSRPYSSSPFFALYHRPYHCTITNNGIKKRNEPRAAKRTVKCISIKFRFNCLAFATHMRHFHTLFSKKCITYCINTFSHVFIIYLVWS